MPRRRSGRGRSSRRRRDKPAPAPESDKPGRRAGRSTTRAGKRPQRRAPRAPQSPAPETRDPFLGRNIAGYEILERLDTGATCITFGARQPAMDRLVTLDVLTDEAAADQATVRNFYDTARIAAQSQHPNIVSIYDVTEADGLHVRIMEHVEGQRVGELLSARRRFPSDDAVRVAIGIIEALRSANATGMPGLALDPGHVLITARGEVKLLPPILSPAGAAPLDDTYVLRAAGVLLYAMLSGGRVGDLKAALEPGSPAPATLAPVEAVALGTRQEVAQAIERLLGGGGERARSGADATLAELRGLLEVDEELETRARTAAERASERRKRGRLGIVVAIAVPAVVLMAVIGVFLHNARRRERIRRQFTHAQDKAADILKEAKSLEAEFFDKDRTTVAAKDEIDAIVATRQKAKKPYRDFLKKHPDSPDAKKARDYIDAIEDTIVPFRDDRGPHWIRRMAVRAELRSLEKAYADEFRRKINTGGRLDEKAWREKYTDLIKQHRSDPRIRRDIQDARDKLLRKILEGQLSIEDMHLPQQLRRYLEKDDLRGYVDALRKFRAKYAGIAHLREKADRSYERQVLRAEPIARKVYRSLDAKAQRLANHKKLKDARAVYQKAIKDFGPWPHIVDEARKALAKLPKG